MSVATTTAGETVRISTGKSRDRNVASLIAFRDQTLFVNGEPAMQQPAGVYTAPGLPPSPSGRRGSTRWRRKWTRGSWWKEAWK